MSRKPLPKFPQSEYFVHFITDHAKYGTHVHCFLASRTDPAHPLYYGLAIRNRKDGLDMKRGRFIAYSRALHAARTGEHREWGAWQMYGAMDSGDGYTRAVWAETGKEYVHKEFNRNFVKALKEADQKEGGSLK